MHTTFKALCCHQRSVLKFYTTQGSGSRPLSSCSAKTQRKIADGGRIWTVLAAARGALAPHRPAWPPVARRLAPLAPRSPAPAPRSFEQSFDAPCLLHSSGQTSRLRTEIQNECRRKRRTVGGAVVLAAALRLFCFTDDPKPRAALRHVDTMLQRGWLDSWPRRTAIFLRCSRCAARPQRWG